MVYVSLIFFLSLKYRLDMLPKKEKRKKKGWIKKVFKKFKIKWIFICYMS